MTPLLTAIYDAYNNDAPLKAAMGGGLYLESAPPDTPYPYGTFSLVSREPLNMLTETYHTVTVQFAIFSDDSSAADVCAIFETLDDVYNAGELTIGGHTLVSMLREHDSLEMIRPESIWRYAARYRIVMKE